MSKTNRTFWVIAFLLGFLSVNGQSEIERKVLAAKDAAAKADTGWTTGASFGLDLSGMGMFNPKVGAGGNRFGIGGLGRVFADYKRGKVFWSNDLNLQLAAQRTQVVNTQTVNGVTSTQYRSDFLKNLDVLRLNSRFGYAIIGSKIFAAVDMLAQTFVLPTYPGNTLQPINDGEKSTARFLNPLTLTVAPGLAYNPSKHLSFFYSPAGVRFINVPDDRIALLTIHGHEAGSNYFLGIGSELKVGYNNKFFKDKVSINSRLGLYSNYLKEPTNVDVLWNNTIDIQIFKGLSLGLLGELFYDHDMKVQIDRNGNGVFGETKATNTNLEGADELAPAASITGAFLLKYSRIF